jgi:hypothetical protein
VCATIQSAFMRALRSILSSKSRTARDQSPAVAAKWPRYADTELLNATGGGTTTQASRCAVTSTPGYGETAGAAAIPGDPAAGSPEGLIRCPAEGMHAEIGGSGGGRTADKPG